MSCGCQFLEVKRFVGFRVLGFWCFLCQVGLTEAAEHMKPPIGLTVTTISNGNPLVSSSLSLSLSMSMCICIYIYNNIIHVYI